MFDSVPIWAILALSAMGMLALACAICWVRNARLRRWKKILAESADSLPKKSRWIKRLPAGIALDSKEPLFEVLYAHFRQSSHTPAASVLGMTLEKARSSSDLDKLSRLSAGTEVSDEEKITLLMSARPDSGDLVPTDALAHNFIIHLIEVLKGKKKLSTGLEHAVLDSLSAGGGIAGAKLGGVLGLLIAPLLVGVASVVLPVCAVLGAFAGSLAGKKMGGHFKNRRYHTILKKRKRLSKRFKKWFLSRFPEFLAEREASYRNVVESCRKLVQQNQGKLARFFFPDLMTTFLDMCLERLKSDRAKEKAQLLLLQRKIKLLPAEDLASILDGLDEQSARVDPSLFGYFIAYQGVSRELRELDKLLQVSA